MSSPPSSARALRSPWIVLGRRPALPAFVPPPVAASRLHVVVVVVARSVRSVRSLSANARGDSSARLPQACLRPSALPPWSRSPFAATAGDPQRCEVVPKPSPRGGYSFPCPTGAAAGGCVHLAFLPPRSGCSRTWSLGAGEKGPALDSIHRSLQQPKPPFLSSDGPKSRRVPPWLRSIDPILFGPCSCDHDGLSPRSGLGPLAIFTAFCGFARGARSGGRSAARAALRATG